MSNTGSDTTATISLRHLWASLVFVHGGIRDGQQRFRRRSVGGIGGGPQAHRDGPLAAGLALPALAQAFKQVAAFRLPAARKNEQEFVAPLATTQIVRAQVMAQETRHPAKSLVTRGMSEPVVDPLQIVDVDDDHREP